MQHGDVTGIVALRKWNDHPFHDHLVGLTAERPLVLLRAPDPSSSSHCYRFELGARAAGER
jgi:hypothetical protein